LTAVTLPLFLACSEPTKAQVYFPAPVPYGGYRYVGETSDVRLAITPKEAAVYVDGYFAGIVDDYDGVFQRLHVLAGEHEIVIFLQGYRSIHERVYLSPNATRKIERTMEKLSPGEAPEAPPVPAEGPPPEQPRPQPRHNGRPRDGARQPVPPPDTPSQVRGGTLSLQVRPGNTEILVDGRRWDGPSNDERLIVQVTEGPHRVEVRREGYVPYAVEVSVAAGETRPLNITLPRDNKP
jgi:hypothetical protein